MTVVEVQAGGVGRWRKPASLRRRVVLILSFVVAAAFLAGAAFLYEEAVEDRHAIEHHAMAEAVAASGTFDREVAATGFLLQGLSRSPALKGNDLKAFYDQLSETPRPEGSWFVLWDMNGQVLNTIRPFGTRLPTRAEIGGTENGFERARVRGLSISNRTMAPVLKVPAIAVHLRVDGAEGEMVGMLSMALPESRLNAVVREHPLPSDWTTTVLDRNLVPIAASAPPPGSEASAISPAMIERLRDLPATGYFTVRDDTGVSLVGIQRSAATGYTTITTVPSAAANAHVEAAVRKITVIGALLLLAGGLAGIVIVRQVGPVEATAARTARQLRLA
jgi:two-component system, NarL family, sensor kinase